MKKTLIIALAGLMMFAFTQCGGNSTKTAKGSKEFKESMELFQKFEKLVNDANTCDELQEAALGLIFSGLASNDYAEEERMTEAEKAELEKYGEKFEELFHKKADKLGCEEDDFKLF